MTQFNSMGKYKPGHFDGDGCVFPTPGHFLPRVRRHNPTNKILTDARRYREQRLMMNNPKGWDRILSAFLANPGPWSATPEEEVHAYKVLSRLVRLEKLS